MVTANLTTTPDLSTPSIARARQTTRLYLEDLRPIADDAADAVVLVVSELVTNALRHGDGTWALDLAAHPDSIEVAVHDHGSLPPRLRIPEINGIGGFGWRMVNRLARFTQAVPHPSGGRAVSALLPR
ncbi:ATP-binding protein [Streptomyces sp. NPDC095817]|uniref:ATP-binding protein n=1 Tax=Streptomyces sp. NPDC095817 TaxID=3155082 RepID=UPI00332B529D